MTRANAAALRAEADRIEAEELKAERLKDAQRIPTCPQCGGRSFKVFTYTTVAQSALFPEDPDEDATAEAFEWDDDYESGDHTEQNESAYCNHCNADVQEVLEAHGWTFYGDPEALTTEKKPEEARCPCTKCGGAGWVYQPGPNTYGGPITCPRCNGGKP